MGRYIARTCALLCDMHDGSVVALWDGRPTATGLVDRLTALPGIGKHKAEVALFLLVREYGIAVIEDRSIDAALAHCSRLADVFGPGGALALSAGTAGGAVQLNSAVQAGYPGFPAISPPVRPGEGADRAARACDP
jgi:hypothetical protein